MSVCRLREKYKKKRSDREINRVGGWREREGGKERQIASFCLHEKGEW